MNLLAKGLLVSALVSLSAMADFTRVEIGGGIWGADAKGVTSYTTGATTARDISSENKLSDPYFWVLIKHPIPVLPNLRLEYANVSSKGIASGTFKDFTAASSPTRLDLKQYDIIPYYNILDNTVWVTLDLGLDIKLTDASYEATAVTPLVGGGTTYRDTMLLPIPMLYSRVRFEIPATNIGLEADMKYVSYSDSSIYDYRVKIDYTLDFFPVLQPALELGYRKQKYKIDEADLAGKMNLDFSGFYAGMMVRF